MYAHIDSESHNFQLFVSHIFSIYTLIFECQMCHFSRETRDRDGPRPDSDVRQRGRGSGRGLGRGGRSSRGSGRGYDTRGKREFDRQSGSDKT